VNFVQVDERLGRAGGEDCVDYIGRLEGFWQGRGREKKLRNLPT